MKDMQPLGLSSSYGAVGLLFYVGGGHGSERTSRKTQAYIS
jgi:hypothetical protein